MVAVRPFPDLRARVPFGLFLTLFSPGVLCVVQWLGCGLFVQGLRVRVLVLLLFYNQDLLLMHLTRVHVSVITCVIMSHYVPRINLYSSVLLTYHSRVCVMCT